MQDFMIAVFASLVAGMILQFLIQLPGIQASRLPIKTGYRRTSNFETLWLSRNIPKENLWPLKILGGLYTIMCLIIGALLWYSIALSEPKKLDTIIFASIIIAVGALCAYITSDIFIMERRVSRGGKTRVAKEGRIIVRGDHSLLMKRCEETLVGIGAQLIEVDSANGYLKALLGKEKLVIYIREVGHLEWSVAAESDCTIPTIRFDGGRNFQNVNKVINGLLESR